MGHVGSMVSACIKDVFCKFRLFKDILSKNITRWHWFRGEILTYAYTPFFVLGAQYSKNTQSNKSRDLPKVQKT